MARPDNITLLARLQQQYPALMRLAEYNLFTPHEKQLLFHQEKRRNRWIFGGNRTGKTEAGAVETVWIARGIHPYSQRGKTPTEGWVVSLTAEVQRDVAQKKVLKYLPREWIIETVMKKGRADSPESGCIDFMRIRHESGGESVISFKSCDQGRARFQGAALNYVWFDEEPPADIYEECRMRVMDRQGDIYGTMTPLMGLTWVHDEIYLNKSNSPEVWCQHMSWEDNPYLPPAEVKNMIAALAKSEQESRRHGRFFSANGLVYPEFDPQKHIIDPFPVPPEWYAGIAIDPGLKNPLSAHWYAEDGEGTVFVIAEHYAAGLDVAAHCARIQEICKALSWPKTADGKYACLMDSAANQQTLGADKSVARLFSDFGIVPVTRVNKSVWAGIQKVRRRLCQKEGGLFVFACCPHMAEEFKTYRYGEGDAPRKVNDHAMDELRYFIMSRAAKAERAPPLTPIQQDIRRLARKKRLR